MKKVDFSKIIIPDIDGNHVEADFRKQIGNQLYMQGKNIEECELGKKIYFSEGPTELSNDEISVVRSFIQGYSYIARTSIESFMQRSE